MSRFQQITGAVRCWLLIGCLLTVLRAYGGLPPAAAVTSAHPLATEAGEQILRAGGNAFDAAVAITAAIGVVEPYGSGLGGGGFWLLHRASDGRQVMLDGRERAPAAASRDMYLDENGDIVPGASIDGPLAAGIPGVPAAMAHLARRYGRLPLKQSLAPAIQLAREGFPVDREYRRYAGYRLETLRRFPATASQFLRDGAIPSLGYRLRQPALANTLESIGRDGAESFYRGEMAGRLVQAVRAAGGIWSLGDLSSYRVVERAPVRSRYHGISIVSAALPSSGGILLAEMFNMLGQSPLDRLDAAGRAHLLIEVMRRAYRDRAEYLGDSDQVAVPVERLTGLEHASHLMQEIDMEGATPSSALRPAGGAGGAGTDTTHFSVLDREGNRVAATLSINYLFGSGFVAGDTGVLLNDEMDDFSVKPGVPNAYGLVGAEANAVAPAKRPLSSMSPTFLEDERGVAILGTPGGSRIISMVLLAALEYADGGDAVRMAQRPRFHHQYLPDQVVHEQAAFSEEVMAELGRRGHQLKLKPNGYGNMQVIVWDRQKNEVTAASDRRGIGRARVWPQQRQQR